MLVRLFLRLSAVCSLLGCGTAGKKAVFVPEAVPEPPTDLEEFSAIVPLSARPAVHPKPRAKRGARRSRPKQQAKMTLSIPPRAYGYLSDYTPMPGSGRTMVEN